MKIGVFYEHQVPRPWDADAEYRVLQEALVAGCGSPLLVLDPAAVAAASAHGDRLGAKVVLDDASGLRGAVGTPAQIRDYLRRYEEYGVDQVILASQAGRNRHEHEGHNRAARCPERRDTRLNLSLTNESNGG